MEIRAYLQTIRRWLWLPIGLPLAAALLSGLILEGQPSRYEAQATVIVPAVSAHGFSTSAAAQYEATLQDVLISSPVVDRVSADTHVPVANLVDGVTATTATASSNIIQVTYLGYKGQNTTAVVSQESTIALDTIAEPQLVQAENAVAAAQTQLQQADAALTNFSARTGQINPQQLFTTQQSELNQLELQLQQAQIVGDSARATALQQIITQRQQQLATLATQLTQYSSLSDARQAALTVRDHAAQELNDAQALLAADHNPTTVVTRNVGRISRLSNTLKFAGIGFAVALILALGLLLLMELMRSSRAAEEEPPAPARAPALSAIGGAEHPVDEPANEERVASPPLFGARRSSHVASPLSFGGEPSYGNGRDRVLHQPAQTDGVDVAAGR